MASIVVVGSGIAGLSLACQAAATHDVTLICKGDLAHSNTSWAQGGVAVVVDALADAGAPRIGDSVASHVADTLAAGAGLSDQRAVQVLAEGGPRAIDALIAAGVQFDRHDGQLAHGLEAAHSVARILHAGGDATGRAISSALIERLHNTGARILANTMALDVLVRDGQAVGVELLGGSQIMADVVVLATGGAGQLYAHTTNPDVATADGLAMALRAGAVAADLEFYQFHPTALTGPTSFLVSEAVRGEGARLVDASGRRFMMDVHADAELAPRDVVARAIARVMAEQGGKPVGLDASALGADFLARRFPTIDAACRAQGLDWSREPVPVAPAAHYFMGGVRTDTWGRTSVPGLFAVGEVACTGVHGANRLASNSLLEGAVFAARALQAIDRRPAAQTQDDSWAPVMELDPAVPHGAHDMPRADMQQIMWQGAGLMRDADSLQATWTALGQWRAAQPTDHKSAEDANLLLVAQAVVTSAIARRESRGAHFRSDFASSAVTASHSTLALAPSAARPLSQLISAGTHA